MNRFENILVGVDLSESNRWVSTELPPPTAEAVKRAVWLAERNSARVTFLYAIDISAAAQTLLEQEAGGARSLAVEAEDALSRLASQAQAKGVAADYVVCFGRSWIELIRRVLAQKHDLVVAGARNVGAVMCFFLGSTGIKLLRKCPCPVWITQPQRNVAIKTVLVAHDLRPVGEAALALGCSLARMHQAKLHVLHAIESSAFDGARSGGDAARLAMSRDDAERRIAAQLRGHDPVRESELHIVASPAHEAILQTILKYNVELVTMGTVGRSGIAGFITGNTAERLLPLIPCSVLAVKPPGFVSPVTLA